MATQILQPRPEVSSACRTKRSLVDSRFDHDSCGVGFVADSGNIPSHKVLADALTALARLAHRGAVAADGKSSDGVGILTAVPRALLLAATGVTLADDKPLGVGVVFVNEKGANTCNVLEAALEEQGLTVLAWREVPVKPEVLGEIALGTMPEIRHVLVTGDVADLERSLYLARKSFERKFEAGETTGYIASLSMNKIVYKSMCIGRLLPEFFPDLQDAAYVTPFALFHQRYATNTTPAWHRAQPGRMLAHNGEINTVWGNRARMEARYASLAAECQPILTQDGTDSTSLDETVELLTRNGYTVAEAIRVLLPPAVTNRESAFLKYHRDTMEPWDGPAALGFADGRYVGAALDRNGLRPSRYAITTDGMVVAGSEAGLVDIDPDTVVHSGRLGPGQMLVVDLEAKKIYENDQLLDLFDEDGSYAALIDDTTINAEWVDLPATDFDAIARAQKNFGYTKEDVRMVLTPMAADGKDAVWSMGDDAPLAPLARAPRPIYAYFRQRFAQVTNPAIDPLREAIVVSLHTRLGPWSHMLDKHATLPGLSLGSPFLSVGKLQALRQGKYPHSETLRLRELKCVFNAEFSLETGIEALCKNAVELVGSGEVQILLLSDRFSDEKNLPIPMAIAVSVVHHALVKAGLRTKTGIAVEAGDVRDVHHAAVLIGYGAGAVCPWLALETARTTAGAEGDPKVPEVKMLKAFDAGLAKIMSKMGVSVVDSYRGAYPFDILGLSNAVVDRCFPNTPAPIGGAGFAQIEKIIRDNWGVPATEELQAKIDLPDYGWVKFRKADGAEPHGWAPSHVKALQSVVGSARNTPLPEDPAKAFQIYSSTVDSSMEPTVLRELLEITPAGAELPLNKVEQPSSMYTRFIASAMSLGSLSPEAHTTITIAMNTLGAKSNTGEGGEDSDVYRPHPGNRRVPEPGEAAAFVNKPTQGGVAVAEPMVEAPAVHSYLNNKIKQVASGRFGVTAEYLAHAEEIEIKVAQGAKPGEGGQLPGHKVTGLIARLRHAQPGVPLISPPPHHDIYSIEDLAELIHDLKRVNKRAAVGVKLVSSCGVGTVAAGVAKAYADYVVIAGNVGGTGAAALSSIKYAGNPWELGLAEAQQTLIANGMRGRVRLRTDGGLSTARDVLIAALLGADEYAFGTAVLVTMGCDMARACHLNTCPTGIATQKPELRARFRGKPEHVVRFFQQLAGDLQQLLARYGLASIEDAIGRADLLQQVRFDGGLDLEPMLAMVDGPRKWAGIRNDRPESRPALDDAWVEPALAAVVEGKPYEVTGVIANRDRAVGARIAGEISVLRAKAESPMPVPEINIKLTGTAGQSFGAFAVEGMRLQLTGEANDFVGKGLSGGEIVIRARGMAVGSGGHHVVLGNVALYGATGGRLFAAGYAGERFAVRNSGATTVVAGVGDHGCEYMTGGTVVVIGEIGMNFGAGMTGGTAWLYDVDGTVLSQTRYHAEFLQAVPFAEADEAAQAELKSLLEEHAAKAESTRAARMLADWPAYSAKFLRMVPLPQA